MAYTDLLNEALDDLSTTLATITGYPVFTDPHKINPPCVLIAAPSFDAFNYNIVKMNFPISLIGSGPGDLYALRDLLAMAAKLLAKNVAVTTARPTVAQIGGGEYPSYELTISMQAQSA